MIIEKRHQGKRLTENLLTPLYKWTKSTAADKSGFLERLHTKIENYFCRVLAFIR